MKTLGIRACFWVVALGAVLTGQGAFAVDPYAGDQSALRAGQRQAAVAAYLNQVEVAFFAAGCQVIDAGHANVLLATELRQIERSYGFFRNADIARINPSIAAARQRGDAHSKQPGACNYWHQHPDEVAAIREQAQLAVTGP